MLSIDPEIEALSKVCGALSVLKSGEAKRRVLDFAYAKYELKAPKKPREMQVTQDHDEDDGGDNLLARFDHKNQRTMLIYLSQSTTRSMALSPSPSQNLQKKRMQRDWLFPRG